MIATLILQLRKADVCLILLDAEIGADEQDIKITGYAHNAGKACILKQLISGI